ncbi:MAG: cell envelope integrity protein CreD [Patescibacteria group bacterium]
MVDVPGTFEKARRMAGYTGKMIVVGVLVLICWVASLLVLGVISERQGRQQEAEQEVASSWGRPQLIAGPVLVVPTSVYVANPNVPAGRTQQVIYILPKDLSINSTLEPEVRKRGIYSAPVYRSNLVVTGNFPRPEYERLGVAFSSLLWGEAKIVMGLSDTRGINIKSASWNGRDISFKAGAQEWKVNGMGVHAVPGTFANSPEQTFTIDLDIAGSKSISFLPLGDNTVVNASAPWGSPSFAGAYLPDEEEITKDSFSATWHISSLGRSYPNAWLGTNGGVSLSSDDGYGYDGIFGDGRVKPINVYSNTPEEYGQALASSAFGVNLFREVTFYTLVSRTVKYAILFIALTFLAFYLFEVVSRTRVHPFQYLLIGASLVLFYLLLLSFSEHIGFALAYLLSSIMTLGLVTAYSFNVLKARSRAWIIAAILAVLYAYLYAILQLEQFALLFGTLFLFAALAAIMRATRKIEWYGEERE